MEIETIKVGDPVVYIPDLDQRLDERNTGIVTSKNSSYVFVRYKDETQSKATSASDLYTLKNRPDLMDKLGIKIEPTNKLNQIYLEDKKFFN